MILAYDYIGSLQGPCSGQELHHASTEPGESAVRYTGGVVMQERLTGCGVEAVHQGGRIL